MRREDFTRQRRIALYSHDAMGLGHLRRNMLLAQTFASCPERPVVLLINGAREAATFAMPPGVDCLGLPALRKEPDGTYSSRTLDLSLSDMVGLRAATIRAALDAFEPDLLVVDNVPRGAAGELMPALVARQSRTRCVLGLRDVLDHPSAVAAEWRRKRNVEVTEQYYEAVWVYGDKHVYDLVAECSIFGRLAHKLRYTGYLDPRARAAPLEPDERLESLIASGERFALCLVGGGQDGAPLAEAFARARAPNQVHRVILSGPFMPPDARRRLHELAVRDRRLHVLDFVTDAAPYVRHASCVVSMGGYNSVVEVLAEAKPLVIVPRVQPRREQLVRAERLRARGLADVLRPEDANPEALTQWMAGCARVQHPAGEDRAPLGFDFNGLPCALAFARALLFDDGRTSTSRCRGVAGC